MWAVLVVAWAALAAGALAADLPVYCRLLQIGLEAASYQPILEDVNLSVVENAPLLGDIDVSVSHLEIGAVKVMACDASADANGVFSVKFQRMDIEIKQLKWLYKQRDWPHTADQGVAAGNTSASLGVQIDTYKQELHNFTFGLGKIDITTSSEDNTWLISMLMKMLASAHPMVSAVVNHEAKRVLNESLGIIRTQGGCVFLEGLLKKIDFVKLEFTSYEPTKVHVPILGDVYVSVNSTYVQQPTSMQCQHVGFSGRTMTAHIENVPFDAGFKWSYRKQGSSSWHNQGNGTMSVVAGTVVHIDLLEPNATVMKIDLPELDLHISAESHKWMYDMLTSAMVPLVRGSLQVFGGRFMAHEIEKCLEDPTCPQLKPTAPATSASIIV